MTEAMLEAATEAILRLNAPRPEGMGFRHTHFMARKLARVALTAAEATPVSQRVVARDARAPVPVGTVLAIEGERAQVQWDDGETTWSRVDLLVAAPSDHQHTPAEPGRRR